MPNQYHRFAGIDGKKLTWTPEINALFKNNKYNSTAGRVGCALSHLTLWRHIASTKNQLHLVLEDDALFLDDWQAKWNREYSRLLPPNPLVVVQLNMGSIFDAQPVVLQVLDISWRDTRSE